MILSKVFQSSIFKVSLTVLAAFAGTVGGIYFARSGESHQPAENVFESETGYEPTLSFGIGERFPPERFIGLDGDTGTFSDLLRDRETVLLFVSFGCDPCITLIEDWHSDIAHRLRPGVQTILCKALPAQIPDEYKSLCDSMSVACYDYYHWRDTYDLSFSPVLIGVDNTGMVTDVQFGYYGLLDRNLERRYFEPLL